MSIKDNQKLCYPLKISSCYQMRGGGRYCGNEHWRDGGTLVSTLMGHWPLAYMLIYIPLLGVSGYNITQQSELFVSLVLGQKNIRLLKIDSCSHDAFQRVCSLSFLLL